MPPQYDPITQIGNAKRTVMGWFGDEEPPPPVIVPPPAEGRPIPNLGTVPPPPFVTAGQREQRQKELTALQADRAAAAQADASLRARTGAPAPGQPAAPAATPPAAPQPAPPTEPSAAALPSNASGNAVVMPQYGVNSLPPSLLPSTPVGAGPAPIVEVPSPPTARPSAAAGLLTTSERHGTVSFAPNASSLNAAALNTLDSAAAAALENDGRVRLVPSLSGQAGAAPALAERRVKTLQQAITGTGLPADRITIAENGGRRGDAYDVFVDY